MEATSIFQPEKLHRKSKWKQRGFPNNRNYIKKRTWKKCGYFDQRNYIKKVCRKNVDFSTSKIATKKKYVETTWKFVGIWFWTHQRRFSLNLIQPGFDMVCPLGIWSVDLANMQLISKSNKQSRFLLCVIDIFSNDA